MASRSSNDTVRCTKGQQYMVRLYVRDGYSKLDAFREAFPDRAADARTTASLQRTANREFVKPSVAAEVGLQEAALAAEVEEQARLDARRILHRWPRLESIRRLIAVADACRERREESMDRDGIAAARLEADTVGQINRMLGYDAPIRLDTDSSITVTFAGDADGILGAGGSDAAAGGLLPPDPAWDGVPVIDIDDGPAGGG